MDIKKLRRKVRFKNFWNRNKLLPGEIHPSRAILQEDDVDMAVISIWNAFTNIPLSRKKEIMHHIDTQIRHIVHKTYQKATKECVHKIKEGKWLDI